MFKKLFGGNRDEQDEYVKSIQDMNRIVQSDMDEENKRRIVQNMNDDITENWRDEDE